LKVVVLAGGSDLLGSPFSSNVNSVLPDAPDTLVTELPLMLAALVPGATRSPRRRLAAAGHDGLRVLAGDVRDEAHRRRRRCRRTPRRSPEQVSAERHSVSAGLRSRRSRR
jgi:hypothetical protein